MENGTSHGNANETDKSNSTSKQLMETKPINESPFTAVRLENDWFLTMGKYRLTEKLQSEEECLEAARDASWHRLMQVIQIMIEENDRTIERKINEAINEFAKMEIEKTETDENQLNLNLNKI